MKKMIQILEIQTMSNAEKWILEIIKDLQFEQISKHKTLFDSSVVFALLKSSYLTFSFLSGIDTNDQVARFNQRW